MGCTASYFIYDHNAVPRNGSKQAETVGKRNFSSRFECSESSYAATEGTSCSAGRYTSTSGSNWSNSSTEASEPAPRIIAKSKKKRRALPKMPAFPKLSPRDMPKALARLTLSDKRPTKRADTTTEPVECLQPAQVVREQSSGYSTGDTADLDSTYSSLSYNSFLLHTKDMSGATSEQSEVNSLNSDTSAEYSYEAKRPKSNIVMEIRMVNENIHVMPKTSSPFCARRRSFATVNCDLSFNDDSNGDAHLSDTYYLWRECLQEQPFSRIRDVTAIPEAVAGLFSPADHPAYTAVSNCEYISAPKRFRASPNGKNTKSARGHTRSSDVPLALVGPDFYLNKSVIISTEL